MTLADIYQAHGAQLASDSIPLHFGDLRAEYTAALNSAILLDRSHEALLQMEGRDRLELPNRMSTNELLDLTRGTGRPTIFTNPTGRIIDRVVIVAHSDDTAWMLGGPGRGEALHAYLQRNIFFNDQVTLTNLRSAYHRFDMHGPNADALVRVLLSDASEIPSYSGRELQVADTSCYAIRLEAYSGAHWAVLCPRESAFDVWTALLETGQPHGLTPAGGLTFNTLRIRAGQPGVGAELSDEYLPLEIGLWDEVSFKKGCYTGQEIIARMESREKLARVAVRLSLDTMVPAGAELLVDGRRGGIITSSVQSPEGDMFAIGVVRTASAQPGQVLQVGTPDGPRAVIEGHIGVQPEWVQPQ